MEKARILVFSDDREFVSSLARSWGQAGHAQEFAVAGLSRQAKSGLAGDLAQSAGAEAGGAVVVTDDAACLAHLGTGAVLAIVVTGEASHPAAKLPEANAATRVVWVPRTVGWADLAVALAQETALRLESQAQAAEARQRLREAERFAALGRFIAEARHGLGNALTGVLGHSELLLLEAGAELEAETRAQVETIHAMSLKIHETFHRLSSLDIELRLAERQAEREQAGPVQ